MMLTEHMAERQVQCPVGKKKKGVMTFLYPILIVCLAL